MISDEQSQIFRPVYLFKYNNTPNSYDLPQPVSWSLEKKVFLVKEFYRNKNSIDCVLKNYREKFGRRDLPRPQTIHQLVRMFEETGSVFGSVLSPEEVQLANLPKSHHEDDKLPLDSNCWWTSENGCTTKSEPLCT